MADVLTARGRLRLARFAALAFAVALPAAAEDFTIVSKTRFGDKVGVQTVYLTPARMKTAGGDNGAVVEFSTGQMSFLDEAKKTCFVTSVEEMSAYAKSRQEQAKSSDFNEQSFGALGEVSARRTGRSRTIADRVCDQWVFSMGDALVFEVCAARTIPAPPGYWEARQASYAGMGPMGRHFEKMFGAMRKLRGYPLSLALHVVTEGMKQDTLTEATKIRKGRIPAATFEIPVDYTRKKSPFAPG